MFDIFAVGASIDYVRLLAALATGVAFGLAVRRRRRCDVPNSATPATHGPTARERAATLCWSVTGGIITSIVTHWMLVSGRTDAAVRWLAAFGGLLAY